MRAWKPLLSGTLAAAMLLPGADAAAATELMPASESGWREFAARDATQPQNSVWYHTSGYVLNTYGNGNDQVYGGWRTTIDNLDGNRHYRFRARAKVQNMASVRESFTILLRWRGNFGGEVKPDYVWDYETLADGTIRFDRTIKAPPGTQSVDIELVLQWAPDGVLDVGELSFQEAAAPPDRNARVAAVYYRPWNTANGRDSVQRAADYGRQVASQYGPDVMVFGELLNVIGAPGSMEQKAEAVPGPSTSIMAALARDFRTYVVFGLLEDDGGQLRNTAVLFDRNGEIVGKYHKVQLPVQDASAGIVPGDDVPVFDTDLGRIAMLICHDISFPAPAREAALQGAELVLMPIWGGKRDLVEARAIENSLYVVSSGYDYASDIINPMGDVLDDISSVNGGPQVAIADIDLARRYREDFLGDWRDIGNKERRDGPYDYEVP